ncbi:hypothetical protein HZA33_05655 [Candidatus Pacearchaeota archaeon]|nr:hypothetical protein [Candidatus Pacearchaeota archaeon]
MRRGQVSIEYMVIVGFTTAILAALIAIAYFYSSESKTEITANQIDAAARQIIDNARSVYYAGSPAKTTLDLTFPDGIKEITITPSLLTFIITIHGTDTTLSYTSKVNLTGSISPSPGLRHVSIEAKDGSVQISG